MTEYKAEDGLKILTYLGILCLTNQEKQVFKEKWNDLYNSIKDPILTTWKLYAEVLPFKCGDGDRGSFMTKQVRDIDFGQRLKASHLKENLMKKQLDKIISEYPADYAKLN